MLKNSQLHSGDFGPFSRFLSKKIHLFYLTVCQCLTPVLKDFCPPYPKKLYLCIWIFRLHLHYVVVSQPRKSNHADMA